MEDFAARVRAREMKPAHIPHNMLRKVNKGQGSDISLYIYIKGGIKGAPPFRTQVHESA